MRKIIKDIDLEININEKKREDSYLVKEDEVEGGSDMRMMRTTRSIRLRGEEKKRRLTMTKFHVEMVQSTRSNI